MKASTALIYLFGAFVAVMMIVSGFRIIEKDKKLLAEMDAGRISHADYVRGGGWTDPRGTPIPKPTSGEMTLEELAARPRSIEADDGIHPTAICALDEKDQYQFIKVDGEGCVKLQDRDKVLLIDIRERLIRLEAKEAK